MKTIAPSRYWILLLGFSSVACTQQMDETKPIRKNVTETVFASGVLEADGTYNLTAQTDGTLLQVYFDERNQVSTGAVFALIDNQQNQLNTASTQALYEIAQKNTRSSAPSLMQAQNSVLMARRRLAQDSVQWQRYQRLLEGKSIAQVDYDNVELQYQNARSSYFNALANYQQLQEQANQNLIVNAAQRDLNQVLSANNQLRTPVAGKVYRLYKHKGDFVHRGDVIATIGHPDLIYAKISVDEGSISKLKVGQKAVIQLNTHKDKTYQGELAEILPAFNEATQSFTCKVLFVDALDFRLINTQLQVNIIVGINKNALLIPRRYLDFGNVVRVKGQEKTVKVSTQFVSSEWVQVTSGLNENSTIVAPKIK